MATKEVQARFVHRLLSLGGHRAPLTHLEFGITQQLVKVSAIVHFSGRTVFLHKVLSFGVLHRQFQVSWPRQEPAVHLVVFEHCNCSTGA